MRALSYRILSTSLLMRYRRALSHAHHLFILSRHKRHAHSAPLSVSIALMFCATSWRSSKYQLASHSRAARISRARQQNVKYRAIFLKRRMRVMWQRFCISNAARHACCSGARVFFDTIARMFSTRARSSYRRGIVARILTHRSWGCASK